MQKIEQTNVLIVGGGFGGMNAALEFELPALSFCPGQISAQEAKCPALGNWFMSTPISAIKVWAVSSLTPGIVSRS